MDKMYYRVKCGETLDSICRYYNVALTDTVRNNPDIPLYPGEIIRINLKKEYVHFVMPNETLSSIAKKFNTSEEVLKKDNNLNTSILYIGQEIKIKKKAY